MIFACLPANLIPHQSSIFVGNLYDRTSPNLQCLTRSVRLTPCFVYGHRFYVESSPILSLGKQTETKYVAVNSKKRTLSKTKRWSIDGWVWQMESGQ